MNIHLLCLFLLMPCAVYATDHIDGPVTSQHPVSDITDLYAFPSPDRPNRLVLILNSYPAVPANGHFSDKLSYRFLIRPANILALGKDAGFEIKPVTYSINCVFETPAEHKDHRVSCTLDNNVVISGPLDTSIDQNEKGIRLFAGARADAFLFNADWTQTIVSKGIIPEPVNSNDINRLNVLSLAIEIDITQFLPPDQRHILAIAAEISRRNNSSGKILDRVGRPEITNIHLIARDNKAEIRDHYNQQSILTVTADQLALYQQRILRNIDYYDSLDAHRDWSDDWKQSLARILANDYLMIDMQQPFSPQGYFDIEKSILTSRPHTRSGGRVPHDHVINSLLSTLINGWHAAPVSDGIRGDSGLPEAEFPYLKPADTGIIARIKAHVARFIVRRLFQSDQSEPAQD